MSLTLRGLCQDIKEDPLPSCFAKPTYPVWTLTLTLPKTLPRITSLTYKGPSTHGVVLLSYFRDVNPRVVALQPPQSFLAPSLFEPLSEEDSFPILSLSFPFTLHHLHTKYSFNLFFRERPDPQELYSLTLNSSGLQTLPSFLPREPRLPLNPPFSTLFFHIVVFRYFKLEKCVCRLFFHTRLRFAPPTLHMFLQGI